MKRSRARAGEAGAAKVPRVQEPSQDLNRNSSQGYNHNSYHSILFFWESLFTMLSEIRVFYCWILFEYKVLDCYLSGKINKKKRISVNCDFDKDEEDEYDEKPWPLKVGMLMEITLTNFMCHEVYRSVYCSRGRLNFSTYVIQERK